MNIVSWWFYRGRLGVRCLAALAVAVLITACGDSAEGDDGGAESSGQGALEFTAQSAQREVKLTDWSGVAVGDSVDIIWSTDANCDWSNYSVCAGAGSAEDEEIKEGDEGGKEVVLSVADHDLAADQSHYLVARENGEQSPMRSARPYVLRLNGVVHELLHYEPQSGSESYIIAGGFFDQIRTQTGGGVAVDGTSGAPLGGMPRVTGGEATVYDVVPNGEGGWYVAGDFHAIGGQERKYIAELDEHGVASDWHVQVDGPIYTIRLSDSGNSIYIGGRFSEVDNQERYSVAEVDRNTGRVTDWQPEIRKSEDEIAEVRSIVERNGKVIVGGDFAQAYSEENEDYPNRGNLAAFNANDAELLSWNPSISGENETIYSMVALEGGLLIGGSFDEVNDAENVVSGMAVLEYPGDSAWLVADDELEYPRFDGAVHAFWSPDWVSSKELGVGARLFVAGSFSGSSSGSPANLAALRVEQGDDGLKQIVVDSSSDWSDPEIKGPVYSLSEKNGSLYIGGGFTEVGGEYRGRVAALNSNSGALNEKWAPDADNDVLVVAAQGDSDSGFRVYMGGRFEMAASGGQRHNIAAFNARTGKLMDWAPEFDGTVRALLQGDSAGNIYVGGEFEQVDGDDGYQYLTRLEGLDLTAEDEDSYYSNIDELNSSEYVYDLLRVDSELYVAGDSGVGRLDGSDVDYEGNFHDLDKVFALGSYQDGGDHYLVAGGVFDYENNAGQTANNLIIFKLDGNNGSLGFEQGLGISVIVRTVATDGDTLFVGGEITEVDPDNSGTSEKRNLITAIDLTNNYSIDDLWDDDPNTDAGGGIIGSGNVESFQLDVGAGVLYVGGRFFKGQSLDGNEKPRHGLAAFNTNDGELLGWAPEVDEQVDTMLFLQGGVDGSGHDVLFIGGGFEGINDEPRNKLSAIEIEDAEVGYGNILW